MAKDVSTEETYVFKTRLSRISEAFASAILEQYKDMLLC